MPGGRRLRHRRRAAHAAQQRLHRRQARRGRRAGSPDLVDAAPPHLRPLVAAVSAALVETLVEPGEDRLVVGGTANLARAALDLPGTVRPMLEALEEQVVVLKLISEVDTGGTVVVRIGEENAHEALTGASVVSVGYGVARPGARRPGHRRPHPHGLPNEHGRGPCRGPLRRPPAGRELRLRPLHGNRLLRRPRPGPRRLRQRHQEGLPPARARPAPGRQPRPRGQGALPGGQQGLPGADRPGEAPHRRPRRRPVRHRWRRGRQPLRQRRLRRAGRHHGRLLRRRRWAARAVRAAAPAPAATR